MLDHGHHALFMPQEPRLVALQRVLPHGIQAGLHTRQTGAVLPETQIQLDRVGLEVVSGGLPRPLQMLAAEQLRLDFICRVENNLKRRFENTKSGTDLVDKVEARGRQRLLHQVQAELDWLEARESVRVDWNAGPRRQDLLPH